MSFLRLYSSCKLPCKEPTNEVTREMQCDGSPMSVCNVLRRREQLLGIFIDLCSISSTWSPLLLLLLLLQLLLLLFSAQLLFVCPEQSHKTDSVSIGLDFICAPFCRHLNELHLPAWLAGYAQMATGLAPIHTAVSRNNSSYLGDSRKECANNKNA